MGCGCGGAKPAVPLTSGDYAAVQEAQAAGDGVPRFRLVRQGHDDEMYATYPAAARAAATLGGVVRTVATAAATG